MVCPLGRSDWSSQVFAPIKTDKDPSRRIHNCSSFARTQHVFCSIGTRPIHSESPSSQGLPNSVDNGLLFALNLEFELAEGAPILERVRRIIRSVSLNSFSNSLAKGVRVVAPPPFLLAYFVVPRRVTTTGWCRLLVIPMTRFQVNLYDLCSFLAAAATDPYFSNASRISASSLPRIL